MLTTALLAGVERGLNAALRLDATALPRLARLSGQLIEVNASAPAWRLFVLPDNEGLRLALHWEGEADCVLRSPSASLVRLMLSRDKPAVLHRPEVSMEGDSQVLLSLVGVLQDLELDWEYELSRWLGPVATPLLGNFLRNQARWAKDSADSMRQNLIDYLSEEARGLIGQAEANARFNELDDLKLALDRLEARVQRLDRSPSLPPAA
ncbi:ubiquinone biosynthesis accessory factor UbiJ [Stutzerimonas tarimensis]|uniref:Ubiquinone biosynthesis accessory factor UbiJ n=1 Tax=Stutzerimonas tarimensis TaxID=1507735 RepID=A0ABV7T468_9GAMM